MAKTLPRIAILGAGPIGLEAAHYARALKYPFMLIERGRAADFVQRWGHVRLFTPFGMNVTPLGLKTIKAAKSAHVLPRDDAVTTGRELVEAYLAPLAELLQPELQLETQVLHIARQGFLKEEDPAGQKRARAPFRLLLRDKKGERIDQADIVLDCTGTYGQHRWLGEGGIPAVGESAAEPNIAYGLEDVLGEKKNHYANKNILVVGGGYSAATTVCNLAQLGKEATATWVVWIARTLGSQPLRRLPQDPLRERDRLAAQANNFATRTDGNVEFHSETTVEAIELIGPDKGFKVTCRSAGKPRVWDVERIIANVGCTPERNIYRELQVQECWTTLGPAKQAGALGLMPAVEKGPAGAELLKNPEPNFFILGAKSYGRSTQFLLRDGFEQVRGVFQLITGDTGLDLYKM
jgi:thioredoxin reductase